MQMVPVALFYFEREENPGFEAQCDVYAGFGATAAEALDALGEAIAAGPPKPEPAPTALGEAPTLTAVPSGSSIDYDVLAGKVAALLKPELADTDQTPSEPPAAS